MRLTHDRFRRRLTQTDTECGRWLPEFTGAIGVYTPRLR